MEPNSEQFFEGTEKLMEVWFASSCPEKIGSLRKIPRFEWERLLDLAHCKIISSCSNDVMDAYLLSESSLFVSDCRFILKTCGSTTLLDTVEVLLELAREYCHLDLVNASLVFHCLQGEVPLRKIEGFYEQIDDSGSIPLKHLACCLSWIHLNIFYSRKNFKRPDLQQKTYQSFDKEICHLDEIFPDGAAYCLGSLNSDRWYLYTLNPTGGSIHIELPDPTLEILMSDLDQSIMDMFFAKTCRNGKMATQMAGIDTLVPPGTLIDDYLFEPCGYSMNALLPNTDTYVTIHVTPEPEFSYVSFETNAKQNCYFKLLRKVLAVFNPGKFLITVFANKKSVERQSCQMEIWQRQMPNYRRSDCQFLELPDDSLCYAHYVRKNNALK